MASASCTLFFSASHFILFLLISIFVEYSESACPENVFNFSCPENVQDVQFPISHFTSPSLRNDYNCLGGPCELRCNHANHTLIKCVYGDEEPAYLVLEINPANLTVTIAADHPDGHPRPDDHEQSPCEAYSHVNFSFPAFRSVSLLIAGRGENETFLGCPSHQKDEYLGFLVADNNTGCGNASSVYGPYDYDYDHLPPRNLPPVGCVQFGKYYLPPQHNRGKSWKIILPSVLSVIAVGIAVLIIIITCRRRRNNQSRSRPPLSTIMSLNHTRPDPEEGTNNGVTVFTYAELQEVTSNFNPERELGEGGFGVVYHGKLKDGREVAVKRMFEKNYRQIEQFKNEIHLLTNVRHPNLVTLYGSTSRHSRELLLVYEYIPNGTLAEHLHGRHSKSVLLLWPTRLKIAIQTASALCYLHYKDIIHRDIKSNNILLDKAFVAKVADFGLSRLFPSDVSHVSTAPQGTPGYLDPEYHQCYHLTDRSDVYSFGVVLVELISSMEAVDFGRERHEVNLANYAMNRIQGCEFGELVDANLGYEKSFKVRRMTTLVAELAFRCLQHEREIRPSMEEVLEALKRIESVDYEGLEEEEMG